MASSTTKRPRLVVAVEPEVEGDEEMPEDDETRPTTPLEIPDYSQLKEGEWFPSVPKLEEISDLKIIGNPTQEHDVAKIKTNFSYYVANAKIDKSDADLRVPELIKKYGYRCEIHSITTQDGYVLEMHRIPSGHKKTETNAVPILVVHGLMCSSADWVITGPDDGLAYILADTGYDVWLANCRGNTYSRRHKTLNPNRSKFWNFSFEDIAQNDLPAMIDYILSETKQSKLYYIGHSQGTTASYALCATKPKYNKKIAAMISLAPVAYMNNLVSPMLRLMSNTGLPFEITAGLIGHSEFMPHSKLLAEMSKYFAADGSPFQILFTNSLFMMCGFSPSQMNQSLLPIIMGHTPAGASTKQVLHYGQEYRSARFCKYDKGPFGNLTTYSSFNPPKFDLKKITCPIYLFYSKNDWISSNVDVGRLLLELEGNDDSHSILVGDGKYNHLDYLYGNDASTKIYPLVLQKLKKYSGL